MEKANSKKDNFKDNVELNILTNDKACFVVDSEQELLDVVSNYLNEKGLNSNSCIMIKKHAVIIIPLSLKSPPK